VAYSDQSLVPLADVTFSTEEADCKQHRSFQYLSLPSLAPKAHHGVILAPPDSSDRRSLFFCGSWSADRWLSARKLLQAARAANLTAEVHLVTANIVIAAVTKMIGASPSALSSTAYEACLARHGILVDLGRVGQQSPSERLGDAQRFCMVLLTTNASLNVGEPVVVAAPDSFASGLDQAISMIADCASLWESNAELERFSMSETDWAQAVCSVRNT
jgi:hypothetical protein